MGCRLAEMIPAPQICYRSDPVGGEFGTGTCAENVGHDNRGKCRYDKCGCSLADGRAVSMEHVHRTGVMEDTVADVDAVTAFGVSISDLRRLLGRIRVLTSD